MMISDTNTATDAAVETVPERHMRLTGQQVGRPFVVGGLLNCAEC